MNEYMNHAVRPNPATGGSVAPQQGGSSKKSKFKLSGMKVAFVALLASVTILLLALIVYLVAFQDNASNDATAKQIKTDQYQAVFLNSNDGQVYFGKMRTLDGQYYTLQDIYYVRVNQVQPDKNKEAQTNISLAKLGNEIHGPEDVMYINKDDVMFWENLKEEGQVVCAIRDYQINTLKMTGVAKSDKCKAGTTTDSTTNQ